MSLRVTEIAQDGHGGVAAVDADDAAAGVGGGYAEVDAGHGVRVGRRFAYMWAGRQSPWKMWPPVRPTFV